MIWVDYAIIGLLGLTGLSGLFRGFKVELYRLGVWLTGGMVSLFFYREFSVIIAASTLRPASNTLAVISLLAITLLLGSLIAYLLGELLSKTGVMGRLFGLCLGLVRGLVIVIFLVALAGFSELPHEAWWREAQLILPTQKIVLRLCGFFPSDLLKQINYD